MGIEPLPNPNNRTAGGEPTARGGTIRPHGSNTASSTTRTACSPSSERVSLAALLPPIAHYTIDKGHGRITRRTIRVLPAPADLPFPHVNQVYLIERYVTDTAGTSISAVTQLGAASHRATRATPADLACYVQGQWAIEALHWIRDTCYREDHSRVRTRSGPRVLASLRNLAIGALRLAGRADITEATRWASRNMTAIHHPGPHIMILKRP
ncbi:hypothetical protein [Phytohabitans rumicis]|uniref:hypothetical protein n=1 Tax=Phytohabitans rumicis TaxID=1076125 RepID=UPI0031E6659C